MGISSIQLDINDEPITIRGELIGESTSRKAWHSHPEFDQEIPQYAPRGIRCPNCRWLEVQIYRLDKSHRCKYLVFTRGASDVPDEKDFDRLVWTNSANEVLEVLIIRKPNVAPVLPNVSRRALAQAGDYDDSLYEIYADFREGEFATNS